MLERAPGVVSDGTSACTPCSAGEYATKEGLNSSGLVTTSADTCASCPPGFTSYAGAIVCEPCAAGKKSNTNHTQCDNCTMGKFASIGSEACHMCAEGEFADEDERDVCTRVQPGHKTVTTSTGLRIGEVACDPGTISSGADTCTPFFAEAQAKFTSHK